MGYILKYDFIICEYVLGMYFDTEQAFLTETILVVPVRIPHCKDFKCA